MLILKQNSANSVPTPPAGKGTIFLDDSNTLSVKTDDGNVETFPTVGASNSQVVFMDGTTLSGENDFTWNKNTNVLTVNGNVAAGNVKTDNLLYANGTPWDLQQPGGSNTQVQFNDADSFGGSANYVFNKTTNNLTVTGNIIAVTGAHYGDGGGLSNIVGANVTGTVGAATTAGTVTTAAQPNITSVGTLTGLAMGGNIIPSADETYDLGNATNRFKDLWLSGSSLKIGAATISANATSLVLTNPQGGNVVLTGTTNSNNSSIINGNSNVVVAANGNVTTSVAGNSNILTVTGTGANISGTLNATGNANVGNIGATNGVFTTVAGTLSTAAQPNITSVGTLSSLTVAGNVTSGNVYANSGTIGAGTLKGEAGNLSNIQGANVSGAVAFATTANAVAGANVSGQVGFAAVANSVAGANVSGTVSAATTAGTVTTAAQPNITSTGTLTSLAVTGNVTAGNVYANSGTIGASLLTGTLTTAAQPNVTSVGTLSSLTVTANVAAGNLTTTGVLSVTGTGVSSIAGNLDMTSNTIINLATPTNAADAATKQYVDDLVSTGLYYHAAVNAATTTTLETATGGTITYTAPGGAGNGVGAYLSTTGTFNLIDTVNVQTAGTRILVKNQANAALNGVYTYTNTTAITRSLDTDTYGPGSGDLSENDYFYVSGGNVNIGSAYICNTAGTITFGTTNIDFAQFSSSQVYSNGVGLNLSGTQFSLANTAVTAASYGNGDRVASFTVDAQGRLTAASNTVIAANAANLTGTTLNSGIVTSSLTSVGTLGTLSVTGNANVGNIGTAQVLASANVTAPQFISNVAIGTAPFVVTSTTQVANLSVATAGSATTAGTVTTAAQPNITSVGTLSSLAVTGNVTAGNANVTGQLISTVTTGTAPLVVSSTTQVANLAAATAGSATTAGTVTTAAQPNITSVGTLSSLSVTGNTTSGNFIGILANTTSNVSIPAAAGNVNISAAGNANILIVTGTGVNVAGTLNTGTGNANVGNIGTGTAIITTGNITTINSGLLQNGTSNVTITSGGNVSTFIGGNATAQLVVTSTGANIAGTANIVGNTNVSNVIASSYHIRSVNAAVSAAGTAQGNATVIAKEVNVVSTVASGAGVVLPSAAAGMEVKIINTAANALLVYPASGGAINSLAANAAFTLGATSGMITFTAVSATQWYTGAATYS